MSRRVYAVQALFLISLLAVTWFLIAAASIDSGTFSNVVLGIIAMVSPYALKYIVPKDVHGGLMLLIALIVSLVLAILGTLFSIGFDLSHFDTQQFAVTLAAFTGLQQTFYAALKDALKLNE